MINIIHKVYNEKSKARGRQDRMIWKHVSWGVNIDKAVDRPEWMQTMLGVVKEIGIIKKKARNLNQYNKMMC